MTCRLPALLLAATVAGCSDLLHHATPAPQVSITATRWDSAYSHYADGTLMIRCTMDLQASVSGPADASVTWVGGWEAFVDSLRAPFSDTLTAAQVAQRWNQNDLFAGVPARTSWEVWDGLAFDYTLRLHYKAAGTSAPGEVVFEHRCTPPGPPLAGRYVLTTINDIALPAYGIASDTIDFFADLSYMEHGPAGTYGPAHYQIPRADTVIVPHFVFDDEWRAFRRGATNLVNTSPANTLRYDLAGTTPVLPRQPRLVATPGRIEQLLPASTWSTSDTIAISSDTSKQIDGLSVRLGSGCNGCWTHSVSISAGSTPATVIVSYNLAGITFATASPDTMRDTIFVTGWATNSPLRIPVVLAVPLP